MRYIPIGLTLIWVWGWYVGLKVNSHELAKKIRSGFWSMASEKIEQFILCSLDLHGLAQIHPQEYQDESHSNMNHVSYLICSL